MRQLSLAVLAAGIVTLAGSTAARAQSDTFRLGTTSTSISDAVSGGTDTELVRWGRGHYYGHYYWGRGYYRPAYYGYGYAYRPYWYRPAYYRPVVYAPYYQPVVVSPTYYYPISGQQVTPTMLTYSTTVNAAAQPAPTTRSGSSPQQLRMPGLVPQQPGGPQTFPYDGGPPSPVPMPGPDQVEPRPGVPVPGKIVSLPQETTGGVSQLYTVSLRSANASAAVPATTRLTYPAYGEQSLPAVRR
jgi:hypothetical protein